MKLYIKWFYWYRNFGDEVLIFWLLNYLQQKYNPEIFAIEVWNINWMQQWISQNQNFLHSGILDKIELVENTEISRRFKQFQSFLWMDQYREYFKVFGGWEVLDESRQFPHDGRNLLLLHHYCIRKWKFILVWWIGTDEKRMTKFLFHKIIPWAKDIICRENISYQRAKNYWANNLTQWKDFSTDIFFSVERKDKWNKNLLINISQKYFTDDNIEKIKNFVWKYSSDCQKIFFPADINLDKVFYSHMRKFIPDLEIYDWTKHNLQDTIELFQMCEWWIWSRLHFLYPLLLFGKNFENLSSSDKVQKLIYDNFNRAL